jgi:hypothetical protein
VAQQWFYKLADGRRIGPLSSAELKRLADSGQINPSTLVKQATGERWVAASRVTGLIPRRRRMRFACNLRRFHRSSALKIRRRLSLRRRETMFDGWRDS